MPVTCCSPQHSASHSVQLSSAHKTIVFHNLAYADECLAVLGGHKGAAAHTSRSGFASAYLISAYCTYHIQHSNFHESQFYLVLTITNEVLVRLKKLNNQN